MNIIQQYSNKEVSFRYNGKNLHFFLSQALFSSFDIDRGSRLLLKTLVKPPRQIPEDAKVLDMGCGTGVLGISLKTAFPLYSITMQDRDALAAYFAGENAKRNGLKNIPVVTGLAFQNLREDTFDLIVSNLPAKAGAPVLREFLAKTLAFLSPEGLCAVVVVNPIADFVKETIENLGGAITYSEENRDYSVFHFTGIHTNFSPADREFSLAPYIRNTQDFKAEGITYTLKTAYNIPGFDTVPYDSLLTVYAAEKRMISGNIFVWNPGQGHIPLILLSADSSRVQNLTLASGDSLQLEVSLENCRNFFPGIPVETSTAPDIFTALERRNYDSFIINQAAPENRKILPSIIDTVFHAAAESGTLVLTGKSAILSEISRDHHGWKLAGSKKYRGFRILILKKGK